MRRRNAARVRSSTGQVGSQGLRKSRLTSRSAAHSSKSVICGVRRVTPSPSMLGSGSEKLMVRKKAIGCFSRPVSAAGRGGRVSAIAAGPFKSGTKAENGGGKFAARKKRPASRPCGFDRDRIDPCNQFVERDGTATGDHLPSQLFNAR